MAKEKALLLVVGGRGMPDLMALFYVQPKYVVILTSEEGWNDEKNCRDIISSMAGTQIEEPTRKVNTYNFANAKKVCEEICRSHDWDWTISISSAPKITAFAALAVASSLQLPCLYIDTSHEKLISLSGDTEIVANELFHMNVDDYLEKFGRTRNDKNWEYRSAIKNLGDVSKLLALSPATPDFTKCMYGQQVTMPPVKIDKLTPQLIELLDNLSKYNVVSVQYNKSQNEAYCKFTTKHNATFLGTGDWLEFYTWNEVKKAGFADDCQWGYELVSTAKNELDVVLTYKAQLIFAECKARKKPYDTEYLAGIDSKAGMLGGSYVTKIFVAYARAQGASYQNFQEQAQLRQIVVATGEDLASIGSIFKKEAADPSYPRI